jgi:lipopolysaccharide transport system permease protein
VYEPDSRRKIGFFKIWILMLRNIITSRELIFQLFKRDFLMSYRKSFLDRGWILLSPLIATASWVFMNYAGVLHPGNVGIPYPAYVLLSTSIWSLFSGFCNSAANTLSSGSSFILQVKYPHEALLLKETAQHLANFLISFGITIIVLLIFRVIPSWKIIFFPVFMLPLFFLGSGIGLIVSLVSVVATDFQKGFDFLLNILLFVTPVVYSPNIANPAIRRIIKWNPLTYLIGSLRDLIIYGKLENWTQFLFLSLLTLIVFFICWRFFYLAEEKIIEKMSA